MKTEGNLKFLLNKITCKQHGFMNGIYGVSVYNYYSYLVRKCGECHFSQAIPVDRRTL